MFKVLLAAACAAVCAAGLFAVAPLYAAYDVGRAVRRGDIATLEMRVDWPRVRNSLKTSLADLDREAEEARRGLPKPSLWTRIKAATSPSRFAGQIIDRYLTPEGVVQVARSGGSFRAVFQRASGSVQDRDPAAPARGAMDAAPWYERAARFWSRLDKVAFLDTSTVELQVRDSRASGRRFVGTLERDGLTWRVVSIRVLGTPL